MLSAENFIDLLSCIYTKLAIPIAIKITTNVFKCLLTSLYIRSTTISCSYPFYLFFIQQCRYNGTMVLITLVRKKVNKLTTIFQIWLYATKQINSQICKLENHYNDCYRGNFTEDGIDRIAQLLLLQFTGQFLLFSLRLAIITLKLEQWSDLYYTLLKCIDTSLGAVTWIFFWWAGKR